MVNNQNPPVIKLFAASKLFVSPEIEKNELNYKKISNKMIEKINILLTPYRFIWVLFHPNLVKKNQQIN